MNDSSHAPIPPSGGAGLNQRLLSSLEAAQLALRVLSLISATTAALIIFVAGKK